MATAIYINAKKTRGYLKNLQIDAKKLKNKDLQDFLKYRSSVRTKFQIQNIEDSLMLDDDILDTQINNSSYNELNPENVWKKYIKSDRNTSPSEIYDNKIKFIDSITAIISLICIFACVIEYELYFYKYKYLNEYDKYKGDILKLFITILCVCLCVCSTFSCYFAYIVDFEQHKQYSSFIKSPYVVRLIKELIINIIHPFPYVSISFDFILLGKTITYDIVTILVSLQFCKMYHIFRLFGVFSKYNSNLSRKYCASYGVEASTFFSLKCELKEKPFSILLFCLINIGLVLGLLIRFFELLDNGNKENFENASNGFWLIFVALTTVGYGEMSPVTHLGRFVIVLGTFLGTFLISLTIVAFTNMSNFSKNEAKSYTFLKKILIKKKLKNIAGSIISDTINLKIKTSIKNKSYSTNNKDTKLETKIHHLKRQIYSSKLKFYYINYLLNKDTFSSEDDKFLHLESILDSEIRITKFEVKKILDTKEVLDKQISKQNIVLNNINQLENRIKLIKKNLIKSIDLINNYKDKNYENKNAFEKYLKDEFMIDKNNSNNLNQDKIIDNNYNNNLVSNNYNLEHKNEYDVITSNKHKTKFNIKLNDNAKSTNLTCDSPFYSDSANEFLKKYISKSNYIKIDNSNNEDSNMDIDTFNEYDFLIDDYTILNMSSISKITFNYLNVCKSAKKTLNNYSFKN